MLNSHVDAQGRGGHLKVTPRATMTTNHYERYVVLYRIQEYAGICLHETDCFEMHV